MLLIYYIKEIDGLKSLMTECSEDKDMLNMATEEMGQAIEEERRLQNLLLKSLLPKDDANERDCILEVRAGKISWLKIDICYYWLSNYLVHHSIMVFVCF